MQQDKSLLVPNAMYSGIFLGLFWIVKYLVHIHAKDSVVLDFLSTFLAFGTPFLLFYFLWKYKAKSDNPIIGYWHGVQFGVLLFFFASIWESVAVFTHIAWIDVHYIGDLYGQVIDTAKSINLPESLTQQIENSPAPPPAQFIFNNVIIANMFLGLLFPMILVPISNRQNWTRRN